MSALISLNNIAPYTHHDNIGISAAAKNLCEFFSKNEIALQNKSILWSRKKLLLDQLFETFSECQVDKWDGYDALPITINAYKEAVTFICTFAATGLPFPEIVPEPEGSIGFEWHFGKDYVLIVSLKGNNIITYAGILGPLRTRYGTEIFNDSIPKIIIESIRLAEKKDRS